MNWRDRERLSFNPVFSPFNIGNGRIASSMVVSPLHHILLLDFIGVL